MSLQWPMWGQYAETNGNSGQPVDMPQAEKLLELYDQWQLAQSREQKVAAWQQILDIHAQQIYTIGIIAQVPQPVVVANTLRNVPEEGIYNWDPGRSEEHTSELQSLMRISHAVF